MTQVRALMGKRLVVAFEDPDTSIPQYSYDYRAASEVFTEAGKAYVRVVEEVWWYAWDTNPDPNKTPNPPHARAIPAECCWVEAV